MELSRDATTGRDDADGALIVVDREKFLQDCMVEALRRAFPRMTVIGVTCESDLSGIAATTSEANRVFVVLRSAWEIVNSELRFRVNTLVRALPKASLVLIARSDDVSNMQAAAAMGASGLIPETASLKMATAALRLIIEGGTCYPSPALPVANGLVEPIDARAFAADAADPNVPLKKKRSPTADWTQISFSPRELEVLYALGDGRSNKTIAFDLKLSENTVKAYISRIMRKLRATNRTQAAIFAQTIKVGDVRTH